MHLFPGTLAWGILTPEEDAKVTLGLIPTHPNIYTGSPAVSGNVKAESCSGPCTCMTESLLSAGADGVMRAGLTQLLDMLPSHSPCLSPSSSAVPTISGQQVSVRCNPSVISFVLSLI